MSRIVTDFGWPQPPRELQQRLDEGDPVWTYVQAMLAALQHGYHEHPVVEASETMDESVCVQALLT
jgi:hypothetical protein